MFRLACAALCASVAVAFTAPRQAGRSMTSLAAKSKSIPFLEQPPKLDGSMAGDEGFDPLRLSEINDVGIDLYWLREAEIKHCRVAMMAAAGILFVELVGPLPGFPTEKSQMDAFWQVWDQKPALIGAGVFFVSLLELISGFVITQGRKSGDRAPGDFNFDPLNLGGKDASLPVKEIRNGRLAMIATAGMILQGVTTHTGIMANMAGN